MDIGAWWATVHGLSKSQTEQLHVITCIEEFAFHTLNLGVGGGGGSGWSSAREANLTATNPLRLFSVSYSMCPADTPSLRAPRSPAATRFRMPPTATANTTARSSPVTASATTPGPTTCTTRRRGRPPRR